MFNDISPSWQKILHDEFKKSYFLQLEKAVIDEYQKGICYPPRELIFAAFDHCSFEDLKVVIIGQDPYHGNGEANGLCFSVNDGVKIPPSLRNIYSEINTDLNTVFLPSSGNLERWAKQGVLLLNTTLTVRKEEPNSHKHLDWATFTNAVIEQINAKKENVVFLLWGNFAQQKGKIINLKKHKVLLSGHPSPMSANQKKWFGNKHFSQTNIYLKSIGKSEIAW